MFIFTKIAVPRETQRSHCMFRWIVVLVLALLSPFALAATQYISDELTVPLRRGASNAHKIIHAGLPSGTPLEVIGEDKDAGFTQVRLQNGTEGWVPTQYLVAEPVARDRLTVATKAHRIVDR